MKLKIAFLQLLPEGSIELNLKKGLEYLKKAKEAGADIALLPEMWNCGYWIPEDTAELEALAVPADGEFTQTFARAAKELGIAVLVPFMEKHSPRPRNSACLYDRFGRLVYTYSKVHTCDFGEEIRLDPGDDFCVGELDTARGSVKVGSMICYDREFPESARILMLKGAELLLVPNACPMEINRLSQLRGRAYENMLAIATCNYPEGQPDCNGHSSLFDGVAYWPGIRGSRDTCLLEAGGEEGLYLAELDMDMVREYRLREVHGNAYRRPDLYGLITENTVSEPFVRKDARFERTISNKGLTGTMCETWERKAAKETGMSKTFDQNSIIALLTSRGIPFELVEHPAAFTVEQMKAFELPHPEAGTKNLFLVDRKMNMFLFTIKEDKRADLKAFACMLGTKHLRFASAETLNEVLGLTPGSVTLFGILNDAEHRVRVFIDSEFKGGLISAHPNTNTASVYLNTEDMVHLLEEHGSSVEYYREGQYE